MQNGYGLLPSSHPVYATAKNYMAIIYILWPDSEKNWLAFKYLSIKMNEQLHCSLHCLVHTAPNITPKV